MAISKLQSPTVPYASLSAEEALAQMKAHVSERFAAWPHRAQALAVVRYVADYFDLPMSDRAVRRAAFGLMENDYDAEQLRQAKQRLLVDPGFAQRRQRAESVVVEAADFERALNNVRSSSTPATTSWVPDEHPPASTTATPARN